MVKYSLLWYTPVGMRTRRIILVALVLLFESLFILHLTPAFLEASGGIPFFDTSLRFDAYQALAQIRGFTREATLLYGRMQIVDLVFPLVYTACLLSFRPKGARGALTVIIFTAMASDYLENSLIAFSIYGWVSEPAGLLRVLPYSSLLKFTCIGLAIVLEIVFYIQGSRQKKSS